MDEGKLMAEPKVIRGTLFLWSETGTEGGYWALQDEQHIVENCECPHGYPPDAPHKHWSYDGLVVLEDGDHLKIFDEGGDIYWEGWINLKQHPVFTESVGVTDSSTGASLGLWIHADQAGIDRNFWATPFMREYKGELVRGLAQ
jgi:hypothetical protein